MQGGRVRAWAGGFEEAGRRRQVQKYAGALERRATPTLPALSCNLARGRGWESEMEMMASRRRLPGRGP